MRIVWSWAVAAAALVLLGGGAQAGPDRSVLLILADDFGVDAAAFYPTSADRRATKPPASPTPNLANLAKRGVLFRRAWAMPWCSPSRVSLFTGRYPFRTGVGDPLPKDYSPSPGLQESEFGLPEAFQRAGKGHRLAHIGKWHMSRGQDLNADDEPNRQGWPYYAGPDPDLALLPSYFRWPRTVNGVTAWSTTYATTAEVDEAIRFIRGAKSSGKPYFLWLALSAPHAPYEKPPNNLHSKDSLPKTGAPRRAYYEAMIEAMDTELGRLLKEVSLADTTVIFLGDNGTPAEVTASPYSAKQAKGTPYEGGVRVPLLVAGAGVVAPNRMVERIVSVVDLYPTILKLAGIEPQAVLPAGTVLDGVSLVPYLQNRLSPALRSFVYAEEFPDCFNRGYERAIASCCYKLIRRADGSRVFYDLKVDPYESRNLLSTRLNATQQSNLATLTAQMDGLLAGATPPAQCAAAAP